MARIFKTAASLKVVGDEVIPDQITRLLGKRPDIARLAGETFQTPSGADVISRKGHWSISVDRRTSGDLDLQIAELLSGTTQDLEVWTGLANECEVRVFCGLFLEEWNEGIRLSATSMKQLGERGIGLELDIYGPK
ncbi:MAG: hypothetical protein MnENMB40S_00900 [Rhizobiaceae bacterium MnEN-MB40S]|nr:MAG: hypothetical protein MnENMB40S_00900 [Rhizobiaceae bacterium MnEN-MB40S]